MIHDIAIWKLALAGFVLASFSFLVGFIIAALCQASGKGGGYQPRWGNLDASDPPQGGSGMPPKKVMINPNDTL
jgi:hypothetical protein